MKNTSIWVSQDTKNKIGETKDKYGYKTFDDCLKSIWLYLESNALNPTLPYSKDNYLTLEANGKLRHEEATKNLKNEIQGLRKFIGALEKNYLKPIVNKLEMEDVLKAIELSKPPMEVEVPKEEVPTKKESSEIDRLKEQIKSIREAKNESLKNIEKYKNMLISLVSKIEIKDSILGQTLSVKMEIEEFKKLKSEIGT